MWMTQKLPKFRLMLVVFLGQTTEVRARGHQVLLDLLLFHHHLLLLGVKDYWDRTEPNRNTRETRLQHASCTPKFAGRAVRSAVFSMIWRRSFPDSWREPSGRCENLWSYLH